MVQKFRGKAWAIRKIRANNAEGNAGDIDPAWLPGKVLRGPIGSGSLEDLDTWIHEALHACYQDLSEEAVEVGARDISRFLWRLGWRKLKKESKYAR